jgi:hypothetical protein
MGELLCSRVQHGRHSSATVFQMPFKLQEGAAFSKGWPGQTWGRKVWLIGAVVGFVSCAGVTAAPPTFRF